MAGDKEKALLCLKAGIVLGDTVEDLTQLFEDLGEEHGGDELLNTKKLVEDKMATVSKGMEIAEDCGVPYLDPVWSAWKGFRELYQEMQSRSFDASSTRFLEARSALLSFSDALSRADPPFIHPVRSAAKRAASQHDDKDGNDRPRLFRRLFP